jgi:type IX secretion system PorP/SprF family membrane protein
LAVPLYFINLRIGMPISGVRNARSVLYAFVKTFVFTLIACTSVNGQENVLFFVNPYALNPSYAGSEGRPSFYLNYRRQWINVEGSPQVGNFSFHMPLKKYVSLGANVANDKRGLFNTTSVLISGAYTVLLGDFKSMRFGISAGGGTTKLDLSQVDEDDLEDPALLNGGNSFMQGNAGISFHLKSFHGGISLPFLFEPSYISGNAAAFNPLQTLVIHGSNRFHFLKNKHMLEPHLVYRYRKDQPSQLEAALTYHMNHLLWVGGSYKQNFGNSGFLGFHFNKVFGLGYAYTFKTASGNELNSPSHEIQLTLLLGQKRKDIPFYSFVDTDKEKKIQHHKYQSASATIAQNRQNKPVAKDKPPVVNENHQARLPDNVTKKPVTQPQKTPPQKTTPVVKPETKKPVVTQAQKPPVKPEAKKLGQMPHVHDTLHPAHVEEKEKIARLEAHAEKPDEHHGEDPAAHPHAERHEFVKRGSHSEEMEIGDFVIAGVFRSKVNAEHFAAGLKQHGFNTADHGHLTEKNLWYVYLAHTDNLDKAKAERDKFRKMKIFRDAWLLTVHH